VCGFVECCFHGGSGMLVLLGLDKFGAQDFGASK
jgi:hypothetical protein